MPQPPSPSKPQHLFPESLQITPATLVELAPRLASYMPARPSDMTWPAIVEAALFLSGEMGVNHTLWGRACAVMGREYAAVAMAIVSTRSEKHFTSGPGGYFAGMLRKFEKNPADLCLGRTLWKLKDERWGKDGHKERRNVEQRCRIEMRTKKSMHPDLQPATRFQVTERASNTSGGFMPVGSALPYQPTAWPMSPVQPRTSLLLPSTSKDGQPSPRLRGLEEEWIRSKLVNPKKN